MRRLRRVWPVAVALVCGVVIWALVTFVDNQGDAFDAAVSRAESAEAQVVVLTDEIMLLRGQVAALARQVEQMGGQPVVIVEGDQPHTITPTTTTSTTTTSTSSTTTTEPSTTTTTEPCLLGIVCP